MGRGKSKQASRGRGQPGSRSTFPILLALGGLVLLGVAALALLQGRGGSTDFTPQVKGSPALKADQQKVDLGDVPLGTPVQVQFTLTNVGDQTLRFTEEPYIEVVEGC